MDPPDSTESNLNLSIDSEIFGHRPDLQYDINDDFLQDFFFVSNENKESVVADQLENGSLEYDHNMKSGPENPDSDDEFKPSAPNILDKDQSFHTMIEKLKQQNKELKEKSLKQECELAEYEEKLSEKMSDLLKVQMERDSLIQNLGVADNERASLQLKVEEKEAELKQFKELIQKQVSEEVDIQALKKQVQFYKLNEVKLLKKTEKDLQRNADLLTKCRENLKLLRRRNKKLVATILEFGDVLECKELLSVRKKKYLEVVRKQFKDEEGNSLGGDDFNFSSEDENAEINHSGESNKMPVFNGLLIKKEENSSHSNGLPVDSYSSSEVSTNGFLHGIKSSPHFALEDENFVDSTKSHKYITSSLAKNGDVTLISHIISKTEGTSNHVQNEVSLDKTSHLSPDSNFQSFASGTESLCSEDMDITDESFAKIKEGIKGWVLKSENYAPLSPLPPSPSPKSNCENRDGILQNEGAQIEKSDIFTALTPVSDSLEPLSECTEHKNMNTEILNKKDKKSSLLTGESEKTGSSSQIVPFSSIPCLDQQNTPPEISSECFEKKNVLCPQNLSTLENESEITENTNKVQISPNSELDEQTTPSSPAPSSAFEKENVPQIFSNPEFEKIKDSDQFIPFSNGTNQNDMPSSVCTQKKNILSHQNSKGFEPHIEESSESSVLNNSTVSESFVSPPTIPTELHYLSSSYSEDNSFKILHKGNSVYDYMINPETKLSVCILTVPSKRSSLNDETTSLSGSAVKRPNMLPHEGERMKRIFSLYKTTEKQFTLIKRQAYSIGSSQYSHNSADEILPHICVVVESEDNLSVNTGGNASASENATDSGMDLDDTAFDDVCKDNSLVNTKGQTDENLSLVSSSCDVSTPSKRKLTSSSFKYHAGSQCQLPERKYDTESNDQSKELHHKHNVVPGINEIVNIKKRVTENIEELPCKKLKLEVQLSKVVEGKGITLSSDNSVSLSAKTTQLSPEKAQQKLKYSPAKNLPLLNTDNPQLVLKNSPSKIHTLSNSHSSKPELNVSPSKSQPLFNVNSVQVELKNSSSENRPISESSSPLLELNKSSENQPLPNVSSPQLMLKNSPSKIQQMSNANNPEQEEQNSHVICHNTFETLSPQLELNSTEKSQSVSESNHLLPCENSQLKNQQLSDSSTPLGIVTNYLCENQLLSYVSSPEQGLKNSPSKNQHLTDDSSNKLELKNSRNLEHLSNVNSPVPEVKNPPPVYQPLPEVSSPPLELKNSPLKEPHLDNIGSPEINFEGSPEIDFEESPEIDFDENSLVIDEDITGEMNKAIDNGGECSVTVNKTKHAPKNKKKKSKNNKKKKNKASAKAKNKKAKLSIEEESVNIFSIPKVLEEIEAVRIHDSLSESHFKRYAHTLFSAIINPSNASSTTSVIYQICNHLRFSRTNPLMSFPIEYDISVFFPLTERCIVSALIQAERKKKSHLEGLLAAAINNLYLLVLSKESISKTGLGAFCRVLTELCKNLKNRKKPTSLCCELIKTSHKFAPILIASIMGVWPELFAVTNETPDEEVILQGSIAYGLERKPPLLTSADWKHCKTVFSKYMMSSPVSNVVNTIENLIDTLKNIKEAPKDDYSMVTDPLLMLATCVDWDWIDRNVSVPILRTLASYVHQEDDERAFSLLCNLYADISLLSPKFESCSEILEQLFALKGAFDYVQGCAARCMIKLYLLSKHKFPSCLYDWTQENESKLVGTPTELLLKQRLMSDVSSFSENDIISL